MISNSLKQLCYNRRVIHSTITYLSAAMSTTTQKGDANKFKLPKRYEGSEKSVW